MAAFSCGSSKIADGIVDVTRADVGCFAARSSAVESSMEMVPSLAVAEEVLTDRPVPTNRFLGCFGGAVSVLEVSFFVLLSFVGSSVGIEGSEISETGGFGSGTEASGKASAAGAVCMSKYPSPKTSTSFSDAIFGSISRWLIKVPLGSDELICLRRASCRSLFFQDLPSKQ